MAGTGGSASTLTMSGSSAIGAQAGGTSLDAEAEGIADADGSAATTASGGGGRIGAGGGAAWEHAMSASAGEIVKSVRGDKGTIVPRRVEATPKVGAIRAAPRRGSD